LQNSKQNEKNFNLINQFLRYGCLKFWSPLSSMDCTKKTNCCFF